MNFRFILPACCGLLLASCGSSVGVGGSQGNYLASTKVKTNSPEAVRQAVLAVFTEQGFSATSNQPTSITFLKAGDRSAQAAWGTLGNANPVMVQPTVQWRPNGAGTMFLGCDVEMVQASTAFGENVSKPMLMGKAAYSGLLHDVKKRVERQN